MSSNATGTTGAKVFEDEVKASMRGDLSFKVTSTATGTHKWVYASKSVNAAGALLAATNDYMADGTVLSTSDTAKWIAIKHTGTSDGSTVTTDGVNIALTTLTIDFNDVGAIFIEPGEMVILKAPFTTLATIGAVSVTVVNGMPTADSGSAVVVKIAALLDDLGG